MRGVHISATGTGQIGGASSNAILWTVNVNTAAGSAVLKLYNGPVATADLKAQIDASGKGSWTYGIEMPNGIYYDLSGGNADVTIGFE